MQQKLVLGRGVTLLKEPRPMYQSSGALGQPAGAGTSRALRNLPVVLEGMGLVHVLISNSFLSAHSTEAYTIHIATTLLLCATSLYIFVIH